MWFNLFLILIGLATLIIGGELLVKGAVGVATKARLSTLVIGMTIVSFGTSAPELLVSLKAAMLEVPEIAIGNVIGSNIANIALVLGLTVVIFPMPVGRNSIRYDWPMMMIAGILFYVFGYDLIIERWEGLILFIILILFITFLITNSRKQNKSKIEHIAGDIEEVKKKSSSNKDLLKNFALFVLGLIGLYFGARWLVSGASDLGKAAGLSNHVIGITVVAFGTSVPELVTSVVAAYRKEMDISVGNLIGSNIFNVLAVIGITAIVHPIPVEGYVISSDLLWMLSLFLILFPMMFINKKISRFSGIVLLLIYVVYIYQLF